MNELWYVVMGLALYIIYRTVYVTVCEVLRIRRKQAKEDEDED